MAIVKVAEVMLLLLVASVAGKAHTTCFCELHLLLIW